MSGPRSISAMMHHQPFLFDNSKNSHSNKLALVSSKCFLPSENNRQNLSLNPDLLHELNARYLSQMSTNKFSTSLHSKPFPHHNLIISTPKCNKWCTAHVRISWMIYHQQQQQQRLKEIFSSSDNQQTSLKPQLSHFNSNISLFPSTTFSHGIEPFSSIPKDHHYLPNDYSSLLFFPKGSPNVGTPSLSSPFNTIDPLTLSMIERQHLSTALIQREYFLNSFRLTQTPKKSSKKKFEEISSMNNEDTKRMKRENSIRSIPNSN